MQLGTDETRGEITRLQNERYPDSPHGPVAASLCRGARTKHGDRAPWLQLSRTPNSATRFRAGVLAVLENLHAVHENVFHADRVLMRFFERGAIGNRCRIENDDIGKHSFF